VMAARLLEGFARRALRPDPGPAAGPTASERDVLEQVAQGRSHAEIAAALAVTEGAVRSHLKNVLESLHLESQVQAAPEAPPHPKGPSRHGPLS